VDVEEAGGVHVLRVLPHSEAERGDASEEAPAEGLGVPVACEPREADVADEASEELVDRVDRIEAGRVAAEPVERRPVAVFHRAGDDFVALGHHGLVGLLAGQLAEAGEAVEVPDAGLGLGEVAEVLLLPFLQQRFVRLAGFAACSRGEGHVRAKLGRQALALGGEIRLQGIAALRRQERGDFGKEVERLGGIVPVDVAAVVSAAAGHVDQEEPWGQVPRLNDPGDFALELLLDVLWGLARSQAPAFAHVLPESLDPERVGIGSVEPHKRAEDALTPGVRELRLRLDREAEPGGEREHRRERRKAPPVELRCNGHRVARLVVRVSFLHRGGHGVCFPAPPAGLVADLELQRGRLHG